MAIYTGVSGVVRKISSLDIGQSGTVKHSYEQKAGIEGVVRSLSDATEQIEFVLVVPYKVVVTEIDSEGNTLSTIGTGVNIAKLYGNVAITENSVEVVCTTGLKRLDLRSKIYVVYKDGHRTPLEDVCNNAKNFAFSMFVVGAVFSNTDGGYANQCLGNAVVGGHVEGYKTEYVLVTSATGEDAQVIARIDSPYGGEVSSYMRFESITINDKAFGIKVQSEL